MKKIYFLLTIVCTLFFISTAISQTRRYVKTVATGTGDGSSWSNASGNLQAMIDASATNDQVWIAKGTYKPTKNVGYTIGHVALTDPRFKSFELSNGVKLYGGFNGNEATTGQRNVMNKTILSGDFLGNDAGLTNNSENAYHVIIGATHSNRGTLDGLTITGGNTTGQPQAFSNNAPTYSEITTDGGGLYTYGVGLDVQNCLFINNNAARNGGAMYAFGGGGNYINCIFLNNHALDGAASYAEVPAPISDLYSHFVNCTMFNNSSNAAICKATVDNDTYMYNCIIWGNTVTGLSAGSYYVYYSDVQNAFASGTRAQAGTVDTNPFFTNAADVDGGDNILGTADDGLIPQCGPAVGGGLNSPVTFTKDYKNGTRIVNGNVDMGAYETALSQAINELDIFEFSNHATTENLPGRGYCEGKAASFGAFTGGNGGVFQWTQNGVNVGTNSSGLSLTSYENGDQLQLTLTNPPVACGGAGGVIHSNIITLANVSHGKPVIPTQISGPTNACPYITGPTAGPPVAYKINKAPGAAVYHWYFSGVNTSGVQIVSHPAGFGVNDTIVMVSFNSGWDLATGQRTLFVSAENWCGISTAKKLAISVKGPQGAGTMTGPTDVCPFMQSASNPTGTAVTYSIRKVLDASSYVWTVPAEAAINSHPGGAGVNDTIITVTYNSSFVSGAVTAQAVNFCGAKAPRSLSVSKKNAGTPGTITGPTSVCAFKQSPSNPSGTPVDYTIKKVVYATSYTWTLPANASATHPGGAGINDTIIRVTYSNSFTGGAITVKANTNCNTSAVRSLTIAYLLPYTPGTITASAATACPQRRITYSLASLPNYATSVKWTVPASGTIISGQGTLSLVVEFAGPTTITDTIRVVGVNDCGNSATQRKLKVGILPACRPAAKGDANIPVAKTRAPVLNTNTELDITAMPNPSHQQFTLKLTGTDVNSPVRMQVVDATGRPIESKQNIRQNQTIIIGEAYKPGIYFVTFIQGEKKKILRLVKL